MKILKWGEHVLALVGLYAIVAFITWDINERRYAREPRT